MVDSAAKGFRGKGGLPNEKMSASANGPGLQRDERQEQLLRAFHEIDTSGDRELSFEEIQAFLNRRIGGTFDESLLRKLFESMDKNHDARITSMEFVGSYAEAERLVGEQLAILESQLEENRAQLAKTLAEKRSADLNERMNQNGIMEGSVLTVHIVEAQNLKELSISTPVDPYAELTCEGQKIETSVIKDSLNPFWDQKFTFAISQGNDDLRITVWSQNKRGKDFEGQLAIPLTLLRDQLKYDDWFDLQPLRKEEKWQGRLRLSLQWIWSRRVYFEEMAKQWQKISEEDLDQLRELKTQLEKLRQPFPDQPSRPVFTSGVHSIDLQKSESPLNRRIDPVGGQEWSYSALLVTVLLIAVSAVTCFSRSDFFTVSGRQNIIAAVAFYFLCLKSGSDAGLRLLALSCFAAVGMDIVWLFTSGKVT